MARVALGVPQALQLTVECPETAVTVLDNDIAWPPNAAQVAEEQTIAKNARELAKRGLRVEKLIVSPEQSFK